jgi:hypothetical protein
VPHSRLPAAGRPQARVRNCGAGDAKQTGAAVSLAAAAPYHRCPFLKNACTPEREAKQAFDGTTVATLPLNPHPSREPKARRVRHPEIQLRKFGWCVRVSHPPGAGVKIVVLDSQLLYCVQSVFSNVKVVLQT